MLMKAVFSGLVLSSAMANYVEIGNNYCRGSQGDNDQLPKIKHTGIASDAECRVICDFGEDCTGYHWQKDERCLIFSGRMPEKVKTRGRATGTCWSKLPGNPGCEDWCYEELDCIDADELWGYGEWFVQECGDCDIPLCPDEGCKDWCYEHYDCLDADWEWGMAECGDCDIPLCQDDAQAQSSTGESFGESVRRLQSGGLKCQEEQLHVLAYFMHDLRTCDGLFTKYIEWAHQGKVFPKCDFGVKFVNDDGTCKDEKIVEAGTYIRAKYAVERVRNEAARRKEAARKAFLDLAKKECYIGCFKDNHHRDFTKMLSGNFDLKTCRASCAELGYKYISMQWGHQCFCDHDYATPKDTYIKVDDMECVRDGFQHGHGGAWRNSVYETVCDVTVCEDWCYEEFDCISDHSKDKCGDCDMPKCQDLCEDWCYEEFDCIPEHSKDKCGACEMPKCQDVAPRSTPEPTPAPTPHQEQDQIGCEDWCYEDLDCLDLDEKWGYGEWFMEKCGDCDLPLCQDDAQAKNEFKHHGKGKYCENNQKDVRGRFKGDTDAESLAMCEDWCLNSDSCWGCSAHCDWRATAIHTGCWWHAIPSCGEMMGWEGRLAGDVSEKIVEKGCEDWCYEGYDCLDAESNWGGEDCGECDIPECKDDAQGCEDWCYEELDCLDLDEKFGYGEWFMEECGDCDRERLPLC